MGIFDKLEKSKSQVDLIVSVFSETEEGLSNLVFENISPELKNNKTLFEIVSLTLFMIKETYVYSKGPSEKVLHILNESFSSILQIVDNLCFDHLEFSNNNEHIEFIKDTAKALTMRADEYANAFCGGSPDVARSYINLSKSFVNKLYSEAVENIEQHEESFMLTMTMALELQFYVEDCIEQFS